MWVSGYSWSTLLWNRCYYPHRSRDALSPVCGIFYIDILLVGYSVYMSVCLQTLNIANKENGRTQVSLVCLCWLIELRVVFGVEFFLLKLVVDNMRILLKLEIHTDSQDCDDPSGRENFVLVHLFCNSLDKLYRISSI